MIEVASHDLGKPANIFFGIKETTKHAAGTIACEWHPRGGGSLAQATQQGPGPGFEPAVKARLADKLEHSQAGGNALVDKEFEVDDSFFEEHKIEKGIMTLVAQEQQQIVPAATAR